MAARADGEVDPGEALDEGEPGWRRWHGPRPLGEEALRTGSAAVSTRPPADGVVDVVVPAARVRHATVFNLSGNLLLAPFEPAGASDTAACDAANDTACTIVTPASCAQP